MIIQNEDSFQKQQRSLQDYSHSHPYEYLTKLNTIYNNYNHSTVKDYSSASKIKLPFKKFNTIRVPECFQESYAKEKKELILFNSTEDTKIDDNEKKLWKQHREIIKKYLEDKQVKKSRVIKNNNKEFALKILSKDRNNIFLKKIIEKGTKFEYDQKKFEEEVLQKLKNLNKSKSNGMVRCNTAKIMTESKSGKVQQCKVIAQKHKVSPKDFLQIHREEQLIVKYKSIIKEVDCSISEKNIDKTSQLLKKMQKIVYQNEYL